MNPTTQYSRYYTYIKPIIQNQMVRSYAPYIFSLVMVGLLIVFAIRPTISTILNLQQSINNSQTVLDTLNQKAKDLSQGQKNYQDIDPAIKTKIIQAVPFNPDISNLIKNLEAAAPAQASTSAIQVQPVTLFDTKNVLGEHPVLGEVDFTYNVIGSYSQIMTTINNLSKLPRLSTITNMTINKQQDGPATLSVTGKAYFLKWPLSKYFSSS